MILPRTPAFAVIGDGYHLTKNCTVGETIREAAGLLTAPTSGGHGKESAAVLTLTYTADLFGPLVFGWCGPLFVGGGDH
jgi:hypothetical protein